MRVLTIALVLAVTQPLESALAQQPGLTVLSAKDSTVILSDGTRWSPGLHAIKYLDRLPVARGLPYFLFSAYACDECDAGPDLWILRARDSISAGLAFPLPGKHFAIGEEAPYGEARMFVGRCRSGYSSQVIDLWHVDTLPATPDSVYIVTADTLRPTVVVEGPGADLLPSIDRAVMAHTCHELKPLARTP